ncbi:MAG: hypothetical protein AUI12_05510 [Acidobacteria bacterium 13_2_20CM_2_57_6]|nr:MAG: hypothetical protein AUI12_05510 [Acidobacteria bacterium 13_2_20CM_2_57_6]PYT40294.1 MAG: hypothetical protein DMG47_19700 [Acidobacteriota bacterium]PYT41435.1 MAG: hypothetical protein DMG45_13405 [Acidobacteriota bacterium]PYT61487.1 MAG: hypothetical protein DMG46_04365 [Acidobacteriota bacterium]
MCCKSQDISRGIRRLGKKNCKFGSEIAQDGDFFMQLDGNTRGLMQKFDRPLERHLAFSEGS